jgi:Ti-type conjugative transfer relaxase TraA
MTGAIFRHGESRPTDQPNGTIEADPQLHSHAVIFNLAQRGDGTWGSIDGRQFYRWKMAAGAVYRAELACQLQALGYAVERTDEKGLFEIAGVPQSVREDFSGRRREILAALKAQGLESADAPALAAAITKAGRRGKALGGNADRHVQWRARADSMGYQPEQPMPGREKLSTAELDSPAVLDKLTETRSVFRRQDLVAAVAADLTGSGRGAKAVPERVASLLKDKDVVSLGKDAIGQDIFSTKAMIAIEQDIARDAKAMARSAFPAYVANHAVAGLSDEQNAAIAHALKSSRIAVIEGAAGSGKTTTLGVIAERYRDAGCRVIGTSTAWRAAKQLGDEYKIESRALDSWLAKYRDGQPVFDAKTVLIVDEAGLLSSRQMQAVLSATQAAGTKIILSGDRRQLQAIGAGSGLDIVSKEVGAIRIDTNRRQREAWARQAVSQLSRGHAAQALEAFDKHGHLHWAGGRTATLDKAVELWRNHRRQHPEKSVIVLAKSNADVRALNDVMRHEMRQAGIVSGRDVTIQAVDRSRSTVDRDFAKGDRVEFLVRNDTIGIVNGTIGTVTRIEPEKSGHAYLTVAIGNRSVSFSSEDISDKKGRACLGHAYAGTVYNSQGITVDRAIVIGTTGMTANQAYVAASRARECSDIIFDRRAIDCELRAKARASGHVPVAGFSDDNRKSHVADRWGRQETKETVQSVLQQAHTSRSQPMKVREATMER